MPSVQNEGSMRHAWHSECTCDPTHDSRSDDRYRQNFPTFNAGMSPDFAHRSRTLGLTLSMLAASVDVKSGSKLLPFLLAYDSLIAMVAL
jgi:hypothetical protein